MLLKKNTASQLVGIALFDHINNAVVVGASYTVACHLLTETGLAAATNTPVDRGNGFWSLALTAGETNHDYLIVRFRITLTVGSVVVGCGVVNCSFDDIVARSVLTLSSSSVEDVAGTRSLAYMIAASPAGKWAIVDNVFTVYKNDGTTTMFTKPLTTSDSDPATGLG